MDRPQRTMHAPEGVPLSASIALTVFFVIVIWLAGPVLRHMPSAVIPWPAHGVALAILLSARDRYRLPVGFGILVAASLGAGLHSGDWSRAIGGAAQLTSQTLFIALLHQQLSRGRHPLRGTLSYAWLGVAVFLGSIPTNLLATAIIGMIGKEFVPGYSLSLWWVSAVTSMAAITPMLLAPTTPLRPDARMAKPSLVEFTLLAVLYTVALTNGFLGIGSSILALPPAVATIPFLAWAGLRFGVRGYALFTLLFLTVAVASTFVGVGPFAVFGPDSFVRAQRAWIYVASLAGPAMIFPIALAERSAAEARARTAYAQLSAIIDSSGNLIAAVDKEMMVIAANPAWTEEFQRISGVTVLPGMSMQDALSGLEIDSDDSTMHWRRAIAGESFTVTRMVGDPERARDEYEIAYSPVRDAQGELVGASQLVRNVTHRRKQESADAETRRLEAIGRLAGGVAHDFNNLMTAVIGYAGIVADSMTPGDPRRADLEEVERAATRAGELTQQLLTFARRRVVEPRTVDVGVLVRGFTRLLAPLLGSTVRLAVKIHDPLPLARVDPLQFEQVLMNLAVNARDAMPFGGDLSVTVTATPTPTGEGVRLTVTDTGTGMSREVMSRIWEPFFTTKALGQGTGLGLATVHGIVHQAGGELLVESILGVGTTFHVILPPAAAI